MGKTIVHAGPAGSGQAAKICNNMILGVSMIAVSEAFALADRLGLDRRQALRHQREVLGPVLVDDQLLPGAGAGAGGAVQSRLPSRASPPTMMLKDLKLAQAAASAAGAATPLGAEAAAIYQMLTNAGLGAKDFSVMFPYLSGTLPLK